MEKKRRIWLGNARTHTSFLHLLQIDGLVVVFFLWAAKSENALELYTFSTISLEKLSTCSFIYSCSHWISLTPQNKTSFIHEILWEYIYVG